MSSLASSEMVLKAIEASRLLLKESAIWACGVMSNDYVEDALVGDFDSAADRAVAIHRTRERIVENELCLIPMEVTYRERVKELREAKEIEDRRQKRLFKTRRKNMNRRKRRHSSGSPLRTNGLFKTYWDEHLSDSAPPYDENASLAENFDRRFAYLYWHLSVFRRTVTKLITFQPNCALGAPGLRGGNCPDAKFIQLLIGFPLISPAAADSVSDEVRVAISKYYGVFLLGAGFVLVFFGERLMKPTLSIAGFIAASVSVFFLSIDVLLLNLTVSSISGAICGLLGAFIAIKVWKISLFALGGLTGGAIWVVARMAAGSISSEVIYSLCAGLTLGSGLLALQLEKPWVRLCSPIVGTVSLLQGLGNLFGVKFDVGQMIQPGFWCSFEECYLVYILMIIFPVSGYSYQYWNRRRLRLKRENRTPPVYIPNEGELPNG
jgi:hypothetical protein